jgi:hypothetical protein
VHPVLRGGGDGAYGRELNDFEQLSRGLRNARWAGCLTKLLLKY